MEDTLISTFRPSMAKNRTLQKAELGKPLKALCKLPNLQHAYGAPTIYGEGVKSLLTTWWEHKPSRKADKKTPNFVKMNKDASKAGNVTYNDHMEFRKIYGKNPEYFYYDYSKLKFIRVPDISFGAPTKRSHNIEDLITYEPFRQYINKLKFKEQRRREAEILKTVITTKPDRKMDVIREQLTHQKPKPEKPLWKMPKFNNVKAKISTFKNHPIKAKD